MNNRRLLLNLNDEDMKKIMVVCRTNYSPAAYNIYTDDPSLFSDILNTTYDSRDYVSNNTYYTWNTFGAINRQVMSINREYDIYMAVSDSETIQCYSDTYYRNGVRTNCSLTVCLSGGFTYIWLACPDNSNTNMAYMFGRNDNVTYYPYTGSKYDIS